jgi:hypothetical protein
MRARVAARAARGCARLREAARLWVECHVTSGGSSSWSGSTVGCRGGRGWRRGARCPPRRGAKASARAPCSRGWHWWRRGGRRSGRRKYLASALRALTVWFLSAIRDPPRGGGSFAGSMPTGLGGHREGRRASARASVAFCIGGRSFWLGCAGGSHASACASRFAPRLLDWSRPGVVTAGRTPLLGHV